MLCLGIETSCDETALALVNQGMLLDSVLASQTSAHALFGGVVPELASREHYRFIGPLFDQLFQRNALDPRELELVAVTRGPGLLGSLLVGVAFAKGLAAALGVPVIGINHLHAHLLAVGLENEPVFPALGLLVSGGHTQLYRMESPSRFLELGRTLDDAAGEAFDKTGKILGLPYPAGAAMDRLGAMGNGGNIALPRPYLDNDNLDFSFSGLKTAALAYAGEVGLLAGQNPGQSKLADFCAAFNLAVADTLCAKTARALDRNPDLHTLVLAGGVAANSLVRHKLGQLISDRGGRLLVPSRQFCSDNAAMIAYAGEVLAREGRRHDLGFEAVPRGQKIPDDMKLLS